MSHPDKVSVSWCEDHCERLDYLEPMSAGGDVMLMPWCNKCGKPCEEVFYWECEA